MKALFTAIRNRDTGKVTELIAQKPELVNCTAKQPPKKDDGQSPLQVAYKTMNFWAVKFLLEHGADVNFMDTESVNEWRMPVLHDAIMATVALARFEYPVDPYDPQKKNIYALKGVKEHFDKAFVLLETMVNKGADVESKDSYGNTALMRFCLDAESRRDDKKLSLAAETREDLRRIIDLLIAHGADIHRSTSTRKPISLMHKDLLEQLGIKLPG